MTDQRYFVRSRGKVTGPFDLKQLQALLQRGHLGRFHEVSPDRVTWMSASAVPELFPPPPPRPRDPAGTSTPQPAQDDPPAAVSGDPAEWYYQDFTGNQAGPVSLTDLHNLRLTGEVEDATLVCKPGMDEWVALSSLGNSNPPREMRTVARTLFEPVATSAPGQVAAAPSGTHQEWEARLGWRGVRGGLLMLLVSAFASIALFLFCGFGVLVANSGERNDEALQLLFVLFSLGTFLTQILDAVGCGLCARVPESTGVKRVAQTAMVLAIAIPVLVVFNWILPLLAAGVAFRLPTAGAEARLTGLALVNVMLTLLIFILGLVKPFLLQHSFHGISRSLQDQALAGSIRSLSMLLTTALALALGLVLLIVIWVLKGSVVSSPGKEPLGMVIMVDAALTGLLLLAWFIWYVIVLVQVNRLVSTYLARS
jgi:GYF domain 2